MFLQSMFVHQRVQPKEVPTKKLGFQVGPYRIDRRSTSMVAQYGKPAHNRRQSNLRHDEEKWGPIEHNRTIQPQNDPMHIIGVFGGDKNANRHIRHIHNDPQTQAGVGQQRTNSVELAQSVLSQRTQQRENRKSIKSQGRQRSITNRRHNQVKQRRNLLRQHLEDGHRDPKSSDQPVMQSLPEATRLYELGGPILTEIVGLPDSAAASVIETTTRTNQESSAPGLGFIHTSTLTQIPTGQLKVAKIDSPSNQKSPGASKQNSPVIRPKTTQVTEQNEVTKTDRPEGPSTTNVEVILVHDSSRDSGAAVTVTHGNQVDEQEQIVNLNTNVLLKDEKADLPLPVPTDNSPRKEVDSHQQHYAIVSQNERSCLDLDEQVSEEKSTNQRNSAITAIVMNQTHADAVKQQVYPESRQVPVTNIDFREAKQFRQQRSGVENPRTQMTFKLPSYATCLRAQIRPKNFTALKQYYELLAKDEKLANLNQKQFFKRIDDGPVRSTTSQRSPQARLQPQDQSQIQKNHVSLESQQISLVPQQRDYYPTNNSMLSSSFNYEVRSGNNSPEGGRHNVHLGILGRYASNKHRYSQEMSEQEERLQAIFNRNQSNLMAGKSGVQSSIISTGDRHQQKNEPYVTAVRVGAQKLKHEFALKGPNLQNEIQPEASVGTFVKEIEGSEQNLHGREHGVLSFKSIQQNARTGKGPSQVKHTHELKSHQGSVNRFGLQKITNQTMNLSSQFLNNIQKCQRSNRGLIRRGPKQQCSNEDLPESPRRPTAKGISQAHLGGQANRAHDHTRGLSAEDIQTKLMSQQNSDVLATSLRIGQGLSSQALSSTLKGKTLQDLLMGNEKNMITSNGLNATQEDLFSKDRLEDGQQEESPGITQFLGQNELAKTAEVYLIQKDGIVANDLVTINASDKQIEIAFKTNDIYSSQQDDDDNENLRGRDGPLIEYSLEQKSKSRNSNELTSPLIVNSNGDQILLDEGGNSLVIAYTIPKEFESQQLGVNEFRTIQGIGNIRQQDNSENPSPMQEITGYRNSSASSVAGYNQQQKSSYREHMKDFRGLGVSEIRRQRQNYSRFHNIHNRRKLSKTPDLYQMRPRITNNRLVESSKPIMKNAETQQSTYRVDTQIQTTRYTNRDGQNNIQIGEQYAKAQCSKSQIDGASTPYQNLNQPAILIKQNKQSSYNESEILHELDKVENYMNQANLGSRQGVQTGFSSISNNLSMTEGFQTRNPASIGGAPMHQIRPQEFSMDKIGESIESKQHQTKKNTGPGMVGRSQLMQQRRQLMSQQQNRYRVGRSQIASRQTQESEGVKSSILRSSIQRKDKNKNGDEETDTTKPLTTSQTVNNKTQHLRKSPKVQDPTKCLNVKQLKLLQQEKYNNQGEFMEKACYDIDVLSPTTDKKDCETQIHNPNAILSETSAGADVHDLIDLPIPQDLKSLKANSAWSKDDPYATQRLNSNYQLTLSGEQQMHPTASEQGVSVYNKDLPMGTQNIIDQQTSKGQPFHPPGYSSSTLCEKQRLESMPSTNNAKPQDTPEKIQLIGLISIPNSNETQKIQPPPELQQKFELSEGSPPTAMENFKYNLTGANEDYKVPLASFRQNLTSIVAASNFEPAPRPMTQIQEKRSTTNAQKHIMRLESSNQQSTVQREESGKQISVTYDFNSKDIDQRITNRTPDFLKVLGGDQDLLKSLAPQVPQTHQPTPQMNNNSRLNFELQNSTGNTGVTLGMTPARDTMTLIMDDVNQTQPAEEAMTPELGHVGDPIFIKPSLIENNLTVVEVKPREGSVMSSSQVSQLYKNHDEVLSNPVSLRNETVHVRDFTNEYNLPMATQLNQNQLEQVQAAQQQKRPKTQQRQTLHQKKTNFATQDGMRASNQVMSGRITSGTTEIDQTSSIAYQHHKRFLAKKMNVPLKQQYRKAYKTAERKKAQTTEVGTSNLNPVGKHIPHTGIAGKKLSQTDQTLDQYMHQSVIKTADSINTQQQLEEKQFVVSPKQKMRPHFHHLQPKFQHSQHTNEKYNNFAQKAATFVVNGDNYDMQMRNQNMNQVNDSLQLDEASQIIGLIGDIVTQNLSHMPSQNEDLLGSSVQCPKTMSFYEPADDVEGQHVKVHHFDGDKVNKTLAQMKTVEVPDNNSQISLKRKQLQDTTPRNRNPYPSTFSEESAVIPKTDLKMRPNMEYIQQRVTVGLGAEENMQSQQDSRQTYVLSGEQFSPSVLNQKAHVDSKIYMDQETSLARSVSKANSEENIRSGMQIEQPKPEQQQTYMIAQNQGVKYRSHIRKVKMGFNSSINPTCSILESGKQKKKDIQSVRQIQQEPIAQVSQIEEKRDATQDLNENTSTQRHETSCMSKDLVEILDGIGKNAVSFRQQYFGHKASTLETEEAEYLEEDEVHGIGLKNYEMISQIIQSLGLEQKKNKSLMVPPTKSQQIARGIIALIPQKQQYKQRKPFQLLANNNPLPVPIQQRQSNPLYPQQQPQRHQRTQSNDETAVGKVKKMSEIEQRMLLNGALRISGDPNPAMRSSSIPVTRTSIDQSPRERKHHFGLPKHNNNQIQSWHFAATRCRTSDPTSSNLCGRQHHAHHQINKRDSMGTGSSVDNYRANLSISSNDSVKKHHQAAIVKKISKREGRDASIESMSNSSVEQINDPQYQLQIKGIVPNSTQQQQFGLQNNVDKYITVLDGIYKKQNRKTMPVRHQTSQAEGGDISTQLDVDDVRFTLNGSEIAVLQAAMQSMQNLPTSLIPTQQQVSVQCSRDQIKQLSPEAGKKAMDKPQSPDIIQQRTQLLQNSDMIGLLDNRHCLNEIKSDSNQSISGKTNRTNVKLNFDRANQKYATQKNSSQQISNNGNVAIQDGEVIVGANEVVDYGNIRQNNKIGERIHTDSDKDESSETYSENNKNHNLKPKSNNEVTNDYEGLFHFRKITASAVKNVREIGDKQSRQSLVVVDSSVPTPDIGHSDAEVEGKEDEKEQKGK